MRDDRAVPSEEQPRRPWWRRLNDQPEWMRKEVPWAKHVRPWRPVLLLVAGAVVVAGIVMRQPGAVIAGLGAFAVSAVERRRPRD